MDLQRSAIDAEFKDALVRKVSQSLESWHHPIAELRAR